MIPNRRLTVVATAALALILAAAACSSADDTGRTSPSAVRPHNTTETSAGTPSPLPTTQPCADPAACEPQSREIAQRDLASQLGVQVAAITVISSQAFDWPDTCLGVSKPGTACAQVVTPGFKFVLENAGKQYEYHTDKGTRAILVTRAGTTPQPTP